MGVFASMGDIFQYRERSLSLALNVGEELLGVLSALHEHQRADASSGRTRLKDS